MGQKRVGPWKQGHSYIEENVASRFVGSDYIPIWDFEDTVAKITVARTKSFE